MENQKAAYVATFYINGVPTKWRMGRGLGEDVYYSLCDQGQFREGDRVCWEYMRLMMDEVHKKPILTDRSDRRRDGLHYLGNY